MMMAKNMKESKEEVPKKKPYLLIWSGEDANDNIELRLWPKWPIGNKEDTVALQIHKDGKKIKGVSAHTIVLPKEALVALKKRLGG